MKKCLSIILAVVMLTAVCATSLVANAAERTPAAQVANAQKNAAVKNDDGFVGYYPNETDAVKTITSGTEVNLRYQQFLIFNGEGKLVTVGNNLLTPAEATGNNAGKPTTVDVPAHGTLVAFVYFYLENGTANRVKNQKLQDIYNAALGKDGSGKQIAIYNDYKAVTTNYYLEIDNATTLSIYDGPAPVEPDPTESSQSTESSQPTEASQSTESSQPTETSKPAEGSEAPSAATSSTATPSQGEPTTGDAGLIVFALLGVIAIAGAFVAVRARR